MAEHPNPAGAPPAELSPTMRILDHLGLPRSRSYHGPRNGGLRWRVGGFAIRTRQFPRSGCGCWTIDRAVEPAVGLWDCGHHPGCWGADTPARRSRHCVTGAGVYSRSLVRKLPISENLNFADATSPFRSVLERWAGASQPYAFALNSHRFLAVPKRDLSPSPCRGRSTGRTTITAEPEVQGVSVD
jgi:hypothetical protein